MAQAEQAGKKADLTEFSKRTLAAKKFIENWSGKGYEKGECQKFWLDLLCNVFGVQEFSTFVCFESQIKDKFQDKTITNFIDVYIPSTKVMIEQKSSGKDLRKAIKQSDGTFLTPFQQAKKYIAGLPLSQHPRWVIACNFAEFLVYDMEQPNGEPESILLENLGKEFYRLSFLTGQGNVHLRREMEMSMKAGEIVGLMYDKLLAQYQTAKNLDMEKMLRSLNMLCVRLVFCLYAEDAGIFGHKSMFGDYLNRLAAKDIRGALLNLFKVLDMKEAERDPFLEEELAAFPYVNGGLFTEEDRFIPQFTDELKELLVKRASNSFNWAEISPTIFGAVFESTLNPETRRSGGMHYTSIENIHKVIDPLFLDDLRKEFEGIRETKQEKTRETRLIEFQRKLGGLKFLDPACGSGNFLTETYLSLRRLENECLKLRFNNNAMLDVFDDAVFVKIHQFYGIEINDFAVVVARTALWIAESQMMMETAKILQRNLEFLPLKSYANIVEGNALRTDWETVVPKDKLSYIMGNPPFVGHQNRTAEQAEDMEIAFHDLKRHGKLDYICAWYNKACDYMAGTRIQTALVSTNSIVQGESVALLWKFLFSKQAEIQFARRSFPWASDSNNQAAVHCVVIGFCCYASAQGKRLYESDRLQRVDHINGYLVSAPDVFVESRGRQLTEGIPGIVKGSQATDGGNLFVTEREREELIKRHPQSADFIKRFVGAEEFINSTSRYCLWLKGVPPSEYRDIHLVRERLGRVAELRSKSPTASVRKDATTPMLFTQIRQPDTDYLIVPRHSSEGRNYIPLGYMGKEVICGDANMLIPNATLYLFGVLTSSVHMAWTRTVCGRLEMRYRYTPAIYNNFPWPAPTAEQKRKIEETAQAILDARALYPGCSLADLYDEVAMPPELRKAHQANDKAVMQAYGFDPKAMTESTCVAELMKLYQKLVADGGKAI